MTTTSRTKITVEVIINASAEKAWHCWTDPKAICAWNAASPDWHTTNAEQDLKPGGSFSYRMEAKDGSFGFDFGGIYDVVNPPSNLEYTLGDNRKVEISFLENNGTTHIIQIFEAEDQNPIEMQKAGWQAIMDNFKLYAESN